MRMRLCRFGVLAFVLSVAGCTELADVDATKKAEKTAEKKVEKPAAAVAHGPTHKIEPGPFAIDLTLKGVIEAEEMTEVALRPETWSGFTVLKAVEHGARVKKGDTLVWLDMEKIDRAIRDLEGEQALAELTLKLAEEELPLVEKATPMELASAERAKKIADQDLHKFLEQDRPWLKKTAEFMTKNAKDQLEYGKEELRQLEKMYRGGDIREETEEIVLRRQRDQIEVANFLLQITEHRLQQSMKFELPRQEQSVKETAEKQTLSLDKARITLPLLLNQKRLALAKMKYEHDKTLERLKKLHEDREAMALKSPADGLAYYGKCTRGQWGSAQVASKMQRGGSLSPEEVVMTIVKPRPYFVRATVEEKELQDIHAGLKAKIVPTMAPEQKLPASITELSTIPLAAGGFETHVRLDAGADLAALMPGMGCAVKATGYHKTDALTAPTTAVFTEEANEDQRYVYRIGKDGKEEKRPVTVGRTAGTKIEITTGVQAGDEILLEKPAKKPEAGK